MTAARKRLLAPITRWLIDDSYDELINNLIKKLSSLHKNSNARAIIDFSVLNQFLLFLFFIVNFYYQSEGYNVMYFGL
jgi:hypothetical protein